jgi:hypothetical protein
MTFAEFVAVQEIIEVCTKYGVKEADVPSLLKELQPLLEKLT